MDLTQIFAQMATGEMYDDLRQPLVEARIAAVQATDRYNASYGQPQTEREALLRAVVGSVGTDVGFEPTFRCEFGRNIHLGSRVFGNFDCVMLDAAPITIGDDVLIGPKVGFYSADHALDLGERLGGACRARPITSATASGSAAASASYPESPLEPVPSSARAAWSPRTFPRARSPRATPRGCCARSPPPTARGTGQATDPSH